MAALSGLLDTGATLRPLGENHLGTDCQVAPCSVSAPPIAAVKDQVERPIGAVILPGVAKSGPCFASPIARTLGEHATVLFGAVRPSAASSGLPVIRTAALGIPVQSV